MGQQKRNRHKKCRGKNYSSLPSRHVFESDERRRKKFVSSAKKLVPLLHLLGVSGKKEAKTEDFQSHQQAQMLLQQQKKKRPVQVAAKQRLPKREKRASSCLTVTVMTRLTEYHPKQRRRKQKCKRNQKKTMEKQPRE